MDKIRIENETGLIDTGLGLPDLPPGHRLHRVVDSALRGRGGFAKSGERRSFWDSEYFNLHRVTLFQSADAEEQQAILERCSESLLAEAVLIEQSGMYFASKMCLLAETAQERLLYSLFNADEATHYCWLKNFVSDEAVNEYRQTPFVQLLADLLQHEERAALIYLVQILLEGWGIAHYNQLAKACRDENLRQTFAAILQDEARHHGSGLILFNERALSPSQLDRIAERLEQVLRLVQVGPQMVVAAIEGVKGRLAKAAKTRVFAELDCEAETAAKLATLRSFINVAAGAPLLLGHLDDAGVFTPLNAAQCASVA